MVCADHRTAEEKAEDEAEDEALKVEKKRKAKRIAAIVGGVFGGLIGVVLVKCTVMRIWAHWKKGKPGREQAKSDIRRGSGLSKLERRAGKQEVEKAKLEHELGKLLVRAKKATKAGSCEQRDLVTELESLRAELRAKKQGPAVGGVAGDANGLPEYAE